VHGFFSLHPARREAARQDLGGELLHVECSMLKEKASRSRFHQHSTVRS
jgi:hypothetical protein